MSLILLGTRKGFFALEKSHGRWQLSPPSFAGVQVPTLLPDAREGALYAVAEHGHFGSKLHVSRDAGATWAELPAPAFPPKPADAPTVLCPVRGTEIPWSVEKIWSLEAGGAAQPGTLWAGTLPGALFRSDDGGQSWALNEPLWHRPERARWAGGGYDFPGIHSLAVHPADPDHVLTAISCGGVWRTRDGGKTWAQTAHGMRAGYMPPDQSGDPEIQDPHRLVRCPAAPHRLWVQHHSGIFRSDDDAASWSEIHQAGPSTFGFAVAVHPTDPDTAWFVPAQADECRLPCDGRFVVTRTTDAGKSFDVFSRGLPAPPAWHLVYRHCLEVAPDGRTLAMGTTTGSIFVSEDGGESWTTVTQDLPPVFCVRMA